MIAEDVHVWFETAPCVWMLRNLLTYLLILNSSNKLDELMQWLITMTAPKTFSQAWVFWLVLVSLSPPPVPHYLCAPIVTSLSVTTPSQHALVCAATHHRICKSEPVQISCSHTNISVNRRVSTYCHFSSHINITREKKLRITFFWSTPQHKRLTTLHSMYLLLTDSLYSNLLT